MCFRQRSPELLQRHIIIIMADISLVFDMPLTLQVERVKLGIVHTVELHRYDPVLFTHFPVESGSSDNPFILQIQLGKSVKR
jgi:hypothetical protein